MEDVYQALRAANKEVERLEAENRRLTANVTAHAEALQEMEKAGWPCTLPELPGRYRALEAENQRLVGERQETLRAVAEMRKAQTDLAAMIEAVQANVAKRAPLPSGIQPSETFVHDEHNRGHARNWGDRYFGSQRRAEDFVAWLQTLPVAEQQHVFFGGYMRSARLFTQIADTAERRNERS